ncbi:MAG: CCA tRNA nucleotidyltransferase [Candidatus Aenigmatarchaeota archaeon]|nr:MAG: CCA tRNA nucleotidyltransferase [Candidatus Aenigmarchaeota archaeon]
MDMDYVLKKVVKEITPTKEEREEMRRIIDEVIKSTELVIKPLDLEYTIAGSFIRDTWLRDKKEFDLFILFPISYERKKLEEMGIDIGKRIVKLLNGRYEIAYAEHPYVKANVNGFTIDIVPCYKVRSASDIISSVDRTPFHNKYIKDNLKPEMSNDVRLLKQFTKSLGIYGSDAKTLGFSGYLCELLIIYYGSFKALVKHAANWFPGDVFIDIKKHCCVDKNYFKNQPLVVIDPTDPKRNVAAVVSGKNFIKFVNACKNFLKNPSIEFFFKKYDYKVDIRGIVKERGTSIFVLKFDRPEVVDDILWPQLRKCAKRIDNLLSKEGFGVIGTDVYSNNNYSYILIECNISSLPKIRKMRGPNIFSKFHVNQFLKKYINDRVYVDGIFWFSESEREFIRAEDILKNFISREKNELASDGIPSYIAASFENGVKIIVNYEIEKILKDDGLEKFLWEYFNIDMNMLK